MIRLLHIVAISVLIASAAYAYSTKYETLYYAETLSKLKGRLQKEKEAIAVAKAEWALLTRPERLQRMVERHLDLQPMAIAQLGRIGELPNRASNGDPIAAKLDALGVEPATTGSTKPRRDGIGAKLDALGLGPGGAVPAKRGATPPPAPKPSAR